MSRSARTFAGWLSKGLLGAAAWLVAGPALAQVFQTDAAKTPLPQPVGQNELNLVNNSWAYNPLTQVNRDAAGVDVNQLNKHFGDYYPTFLADLIPNPAPVPPPLLVNGDAITLSGLFKFRGEKIDPVADAHTTPGYFSPACGFTGQLLLRGGNCEVTFGWYNVTDPNSTTPPLPTEIYTFLPSLIPAVPPSTTPTRSTITKDLQCQGPLDNGFCPLAWDNVNPRELNKKVWTPKFYDSGAIKQDPNYKGGFVGFAVIPAPNQACSQTKFSLYAHNQKNAAGVPWVTTLIYQSTVDPEAFYMAFEDLAMSPADWHQTGVPGNNAMNDGDFNDFVFYVSGISCQGGNQPCMTGLQGACSIGHTDCAVGDAPPACRPVVQPGVETCDNIDNDCDGLVDNGDSLCASTPDTPICFQGSCVGLCSGGEFPCPAGTACDATGHCVDPACSTITCGAGMACRNGACVDPCTGVTCPAGSQCQLGTCVDPCKGVTCPADRVCDQGLCVANCTCRPCAAGLNCGADGKCTDPACVGVNCQNGFTCSKGQCVDLCIGVTCPGGGACIAGLCTTGTGGNGSVGPGGTPIPGGGTMNFGTGGSGTTTGHHLAPAAAKNGCGCRIAETESDRSHTFAWLSAALGLGLSSWARRRGSKRAA